MKKQHLLALAGWIALTAGTIHAQPAWRRIAEKLKTNSIEKTAPSSLPVGLADELPEVQDEQAAPVAPGEDYEIARVLDPDDVSKLNPFRNTLGMSLGGKSKFSSLNLGKEWEDTTQVKNLFSDPEVMQMLGGKPRYIYDAEKRPDPMVFPPVRNAAIYAELILDTENLIIENQLNEAIDRLERILALRDPRYSQEARTKLAEVRALKGDLDIQNGEEVILAELPPYITENTRGILFDNISPLCLIGDFLLRVGDPVPGFGEVSVAKIDRQKVTFDIAGQAFDIEVKGYDE